MRPKTVELVANSECEMAEAKHAVISEFMRQGSCGGISPAAITISLECWRDANGKLHCKLSVSFNAA